MSALVVGGGMKRGRERSQATNSERVCKCDTKKVQ